MTWLWSGMIKNVPETSTAFITQTATDRQTAAFMAGWLILEVEKEEEEGE